MSILKKSQDSYIHGENSDESQFSQFSSLSFPAFPEDESFNMDLVENVVAKTDLKSVKKEMCRESIAATAVTAATKAVNVDFPLVWAVKLPGGELAGIVYANKNVSFKKSKEDEEPATNDKVVCHLDKQYKVSIPGLLFVDQDCMMHNLWVFVYGYESFVYYRTFSLKNVANWGGMAFVATDNKSCFQLRDFKSVHVMDAIYFLSPNYVTCMFEKKGNRVEAVVKALKSQRQYPLSIVLAKTRPGPLDLSELFGYEAKNIDDMKRVLPLCSTTIRLLKNVGYSLKDLKVGDKYVYFVNVDKDQGVPIKIFCDLPGSCVEPKYSSNIVLDKYYVFKIVNKDTLCAQLGRFLSSAGSFVAVNKKDGNTSLHCINALAISLEELAHEIKGARWRANLKTNLGDVETCLHTAKTRIVCTRGHDVCNECFGVLNSEACRMAAEWKLKLAEFTNNIPIIMPSPCSFLSGYPLCLDDKCIPEKYEDIVLADMLDRTYKTTAYCNRDLCCCNICYEMDNKQVSFWVGQHAVGSDRHDFDTGEKFFIPFMCAHCNSKSSISYMIFHLGRDRVCVCLNCICYNEKINEHSVTMALVNKTMKLPDWPCDGRQCFYCTSIETSSYFSPTLFAESLFGPDCHTSIALCGSESCLQMFLTMFPKFFKKTVSSNKNEIFELSNGQVGVFPTYEQFLLD